MPDWLTRVYWQTRIDPAWAWIDTHVLNSANLIQVIGVALAFAAAHLLAKPLQAWLIRQAVAGGWRHRLGRLGRHVAVPLIWLGIVELGIGAARVLGYPAYVLTIAASLLIAWVVINILADFVRNAALARLIAVMAWGVAALYILALLGPAIAFLDTMAVQIGDVRLSALTILTAVLTFILLVWAAVALGNLIEHQLNRVTSITPSAQVLFAKLAKVVLVAAAILIGLNASGIDLTALAFFGGAVGVGIGFGLQKVVSNLFSGMILLLDRSIKPGDVIEFSNTYGWINKLAARYTSVVTRSGTEYLIPNEDMITQPVINWSHSNRQVRRSIPVGISYKSDVRKAMDLMVEAGRETERVLETPGPVCLLKGFGDSSVDLELRIWIEDPQNGVSNVASNVLLKIWDKFHENDVQIPFPQRDVHVVSAEGLSAGFKTGE